MSSGNLFEVAITTYDVTITTYDGIITTYDVIFTTYVIISRKDVIFMTDKTDMLFQFNLIVFRTFL